MKKSLYWIVSLNLVFIAVACDLDDNTNIPPPPPPFTVNNSVHTGALLRVTPHNPVYAAISNNSGMMGPGERVNLHTNIPADMYAGVRQDFIFNIGHIDQIGEMHVWNHNFGNGANGLRNVTVSYSNDNVTYTNLGDFTLKQANGAAGLPATNLSDGSPIRFNGISAQFIKISPHATDGSWGGGQFGLSEVKFYRYRNTVYQGAYIAASPISDVRRSQTAPAYYNLTNGAGLSHPTSDEALHNNNPNHMYFVNSSSAEFEIDLYGRYPIQKIVIWNYNAAGNTNRGMNTVTISTSDGPEGDVFVNNWDDRWNSSYTTRVSNQAISAGTGQNGMGPSATISMNNQPARFIKISGSARSGNSTGLSAIRVYAGDGWFADYLSDWNGVFNVYPVGNNRQWAGADGIYSVNFDGKDFDPARPPQNRRTYFTFQDTISSRVDPVTGRRIGWHMPNNTTATLNGLPHASNIVFSTATNDNSAIVPQGQSGYYWIGDIFVTNSRLYIFCSRVQNVGGGDWGFRHVATDFVRFEISGGNVQSDITRLNTGSHFYDEVGNDQGGWSLGSAIFENTAAAGALNPDGYIYIYGVANVPVGQWGARRLIVARVKPEDVEDFTKIEYLYNNNQWQNQPWGKSVSNQKFLNPSNQTEFAGECSIHEVRSGPDAGKYYQVYMDTQFFNRWVRIRVADSPYGDFTNMRQVYFATSPFLTIPVEDQKDGGLGMYSYNGKAHPAISTDGELVITYNVNGGQGGDSIGGFQGGGNADIYRPRFIRYAQVPLSPQNN
ncbi:MAG: DUF4185 domain-containing protein [Treponema sp.]|nr:DUF4185 domain-containing protein [Treponema sp.]